MSEPGGSGIAGVFLILRVVRALARHKLWDDARETRGDSLGTPRGIPWSLPLPAKPRGDPPGDPPGGALGDPLAGMVYRMRVSYRW